MCRGEIFFADEKYLGKFRRREYWWNISKIIFEVSNSFVEPTGKENGGKAFVGLST